MMNSEFKEVHYRYIAKVLKGIDFDIDSISHWADGAFKTVVLERFIEMFQNDNAQFDALHFIESCNWGSESHE